MEIASYIKRRINLYKLEKILFDCKQVLLQLDMPGSEAEVLIKDIRLKATKYMGKLSDKKDQSSQGLVEVLKRNFGSRSADGYLEKISIQSVGSEVSQIIPKWNLLIVGSSDQDPVNAQFIPRGSAVIINILGTKNLYALTAAHILKDETGVKKTSFFRAVWNSSLIFLKDQELLELEIVKDFSIEDAVMDLAILKVPELGKNNEELGVNLLNEREFQYLVTNESAGVLFGWGQYDFDEYDSSNLVTPNFLRDVVMELHSKNDQPGWEFDCQSFDDRGPCKGDSGGPIVTICDNEVRLAGIVLGRPPGGDRCHSREFPTRFLAPSSVFKEIQCAIETYES